MDIMKSWKKSLEFFNPVQLKPFLMVTGKAVVNIYQDLNKPLSSRGNWILIGTVLFLVGLTNIIQAWDLSWFESLFLNVTRYTLFFIFVLGLRPSVGLKDQDYFIDYSRRFYYILGLTILVGMTPIFAIPFLMQWYIFFLLFLFDSKGTFQDILKAKHQAFMLLLYNLPVCTAFEIVLRLTGYFFLNKLVDFTLNYWGGITYALIIYILVIPIQVALLTNFYIKKTHDQIDLYLDKPPVA